MADITRRFRATTGIPYVHALAEVFDYVRGHADIDADIDLLGGNVGALVHNGLTVSGPELAVDALTDVIERAGLTEVEA